MKILCVGDLHLRDTAPVNCTPEFLDDLWHSLDVIGTMSTEFDAVIFSGDLFDFKQPSKSSHALMLRAIETFGRMHNPWCIAGNHDLSADRIESLHAKQPLGVLLASGALSLLSGWHHELPVYGVSWQQDWPATMGSALRDFREYHDPNSLVITHAPLFAPGTEPPYEFLDLTEFAAAMGNRGSCFYGHIHDNHGIFSHTNVTFANHGSLNRARLTKSDIERQVAVTAWDSTDGTFTRIPIPDQAPASRIFRLDSANAAKAEAKTLDQFLAAVGRSSLSISSTESVVQHIRSMDVPKPVMEKAVTLLTEQE